MHSFLVPPSSLALPSCLVTGTETTSQPRSFSYDWGTGQPSQLGASVDLFSIRWTRQLYFVEDTVLFVEAVADDILKAYVISNDGNGPDNLRTLILDAPLDNGRNYGHISLQASLQHTLIIEYADTGIDANVDFEFWTRSQEDCWITDFHANTDWQNNAVWSDCYYAKDNLILNFGSGPAPNTGDDFSAYLYKSFSVPSESVLMLYGQADDLITIRVREVSPNGKGVISDLGQYMNLPDNDGLRWNSLV